MIDRAKISANLPVPHSALAIGAHPDDIEFGCGGTLAKWARAGCAIFHLVCTDGSRGTWDEDDDATALIARRQDEQRAAARRLGGTDPVVFLGRQDGELINGLSERAEVAEWLRRIRPQVVFAHDPWKRWRIHPDHRHAGFLATDAIVAARDPLFFPEFGLAVHRPDALLLWEADEIDHAEDVTATFEVKIEALFEHKSQLRSTMHISGGDNEKDETLAFCERIRGELEEVGTLIDVELAEGFKLVTNL